MKSILTSMAAMAIVLATGCGMSAEEKDKVIDEAAAMRAKQVCESGGTGAPLDMYSEKLNYLLEQLNEEGIKAQADIDKATDLFDKKIKESCPDFIPQLTGVPYTLLAAITFL